MAHNTNAKTALMQVDPEAILTLPSLKLLLATARIREDRSNIVILKPMQHYAAFGTGLLMTCALVVGARAQLPSESSLPGREQLAAVPSERELPDDPIANDPRAEIPGEADLPQDHNPVAEQVERQDAAGRELKELSNAEDHRVWFSPDVPGHTQRIRQLVFASDGVRLVSAGDDKLAHIWKKDLASEWIHERTIRWPIQRGQKGRIVALALHGERLALAGESAYGSNGEIYIVHVRTGELLNVLTDEKRQHRQLVTRIVFSASGNKLLSLDAVGKTIVWQRDKSGLWTIEKVVRNSLADDIAEPRMDGTQQENIMQTAAALAGESTVLLPRSIRVSGVNSPFWDISRIELGMGGRSDIAIGLRHAEKVVSLDCTQDGSRVVSADGAGAIYMRTPTGDGKGAQIVLERGVFDTEKWRVSSLHLNRDGQRLLVDKDHPDGKGGILRQIELWDLSDPSRFQKLRSIPVADRGAIAISSDGKSFAYAVRGSITMESADGQNAKLAHLADVGHSLSYVEFLGGTSHRFAFGKNAAEFEFDAANLRMLPAVPTARHQQGDATTSTPWRLTIRGAEYWLLHKDGRAFRLPFNQRFGRVATPLHNVCLIRDQRSENQSSQPVAIAIGLDGQNEILVFRIPHHTNNQAELVRVFRGHWGAVKALSVSPDGRYLISAATDGTVCLWNIEEFSADDPIAMRWGLRLTAANGRITVAASDSRGPMHFRGLRQGDVIRKVTWYPGDQAVSVDQPNDILASFQTHEWPFTFTLDYERLGQPQPRISVHPAWYPVASLFRIGDGEWVFWTPAGYYASSLEAQRLFGWQLNPLHMRQLPTFYLAAQFQQILERPEVMRRLLVVGSLDKALGILRALPPASPDKLISRTAEMAPVIVIEQPEGQTEVIGRQARLRASVTTPRETNIAWIRAIANGVAFEKPTKISESSSGGLTQSRFEWQGQLPSDAIVRIQVAAATDSRVWGQASVEITQRIRMAPPARLLFLGAGVGEYQDAQIEDIPFAVQNVNALAATLQSGHAPHYETHSLVLTNNNVNRSTWQAKSREISAGYYPALNGDDVLVVFLSGHGIRDEETGHFYFVTADANYSDLMGRRFSDCISLNDLAPFSQLACRKILLLDTCHSGAIQSESSDQLRRALQQFQMESFLILTASQGTQEAFSLRNRQLGRFTSRLVEALQGEADGIVGMRRRDGVVSLRETIAYVCKTVSQDSRVAGERYFQTPMASPRDVIELIDLPLTRTRSSR